MKVPNFKELVSQLLDMKMIVPERERKMWNLSIFWVAFLLIKYWILCQYFLIQWEISVL